MKFNTKSLISVFVAAMVAMAALSGGVAANPSTTTESDLHGGDHVVLDPSSDEIEELKFEVTNTNTSSVTVTVTDKAETSSETDTQLASITDADADMTLDNGTYTTNLSHVDLSNEAERNVSETYNMTVSIEHVHDDDGDGVDNTNTTTVEITGEMISTSDERTVLVSDSIPDGLGADVTIEEASDGFLGFGADEYDTYEASNNVPHGGNNYANSTIVFSGGAADAYDDAAADVSSGDPVYGMTVMVQGELVPVYADSAGDLHDENGSYAVYDSATSELTVEYGEDRSDAYSSDVRVVNNDPLSEGGFSTVWEVYGLGNAISLVTPW